jgi:hypothetical protein
MIGAIEEVKRLKEEYEKAKQPAIEALLAQKKIIDEQLEDLGYFAKSSDPRKRAPKKCRICGNTGHTSRTCPQADKK